MTSPADSEVTTQLADVLKRHEWWLAGTLGVPGMTDATTYKCLCGWNGDDPRTHVASALLASFVLVPKDQLHQEWSNVFEKRKGTEWSERRTAGFPDRGVPDANMRVNEANPVDWMRNMRIEVRLVGPWRPADSKEHG
jgi:hypothetical protein